METSEGLTFCEDQANICDAGIWCCTLAQVPASPFPVQLMYLERQQKMVQIPALLPPTAEMQMERQAAGFDPAQTLLL